ncbi:UNVERIFIED_ORG: ornithine cyclodeaminase/alanine dehydrogenase [Xanthobacter viscosus]|uniref:Ornithine cyclodeaminase family protein n=1 Tax=Xanthobacter autotrophicus TaxID=280 RepID=A0A6C1KDS6_XANAU|nr:ornithine cyclodeaminase family protein [Xanthobacter autotrophicus]TLX41394.1 ornithine cyclodeaminase family protein [Xanthobacter autotrophicus]
MFESNDLLVGTQIPPTLFLTDKDVGKLCEWRNAVMALRSAYAASRDRPALPPRTMARGDGIWLRSLTAISPSGDFMGCKLIAASPRSGYVSYLISLFNAKTMNLAALIDGNQVTGIRTAATSAVAVDAIAPHRALRVTVIGTGFEAQGQLEALASMRRIESVSVFSPSPESRARYVGKFATLIPDLRVRACDSAEDAVSGADVVICAARSRDESPVLRGAWLRPGMTVVSIGSTLPEQREVDVDVIRRADLIVADIPEEVGHETGDMLKAKDEGVIFKEKMCSLSSIVSGQQEARPTPDSIILFKSVGSALQDVVIAEMLLLRARETSAGTPIPVGIVPVE